MDYSFDAVGNNTGQTWYNAGGTVNARLTFTYDANGNQLTAANAVGTYTMAYDAANEVTSVQGPWGSVLSFTYDANGRRTVMQDNFGGVTSYAYDANGNLTQQEFGGSGQTPMRIDQSYNAANELTDVIRYSDLAGTTKVATTSHVYDAAGQLVHQIDKNGSGTSIANTTNVYDAAGRITSEQLNGAAPTTYTYDADNELTGDAVTTVTYDGEGNRNNGSYQVGTGNQITQDANWIYTYDAAGEETKKVSLSNGNAWVYAYDPKGELTQAQLWTNDPLVYGTGNPEIKEVDYKYDAFGNMAERDDYPTIPSSPTVTRYSVDGWDPALAGATGTSNFNVWAELNGSNALQTRYLHGEQVDQLFERQDSLVAYWYLTDRLGSVRDVLDNSGNVKDAISYDGWGNIASETNSSYRGNYAWTGRQLDVETNLQYNRARWYDSATGRWQTPDPLGFTAGDSNLYRYVSNHPPIATDPSGLQPPAATFTLNLNKKDQLQFYSDFLEAPRTLQEKEIAALTYVWMKDLSGGLVNADQLRVLRIAEGQVEGLGLRYLEKNGTFGQIARTLPFPVHVVIITLISDLSSDVFNIRINAYTCLHNMRSAPIDFYARTTYTSLEQQRYIERLVTDIYASDRKLHNFAVDGVMGRIMQNLTNQQKAFVISELIDTEVGGVFGAWAERASKQGQP
jgi:RHS repeat-associated protein